MAHHKRPEVATRLARIEGHVSALRRMVETERSYPEIVQQISAVRSSLDSVVEVIIEDLLEGTVRGAGSAGRADAVELKEVIARSR